MIFSGLGNKVGSGDVDSDLEVSCRHALVQSLEVSSSQSPHEEQTQTRGPLGLGPAPEGVRMGWVPFFIRKRIFQERMRRW